VPLEQGSAPAAPANRQLVEVVDNGQQTDVNMPFLHVDSNDNGNVHVELPGLNIKCAPTDHGTTKCTSARPFRTREVSTTVLRTVRPALCSESDSHVGTTLVRCGDGGTGGIY
jgi:hypothetical protein